MVGISTAFPQGSVASGSGVKVENKQFSISTSVLPVRLAILAQHSTGVSPSVNGFNYNIAKPIISADDAADIFGIGSPIHLAAKVLYNPRQSIASIPVDVFAIQESILGRAQGTLTLDVNPTTTDPMTVDTKVYTFLDTLTGADGEIKIGATLSETQANIVAAFNLSGAAGVQYGASMTAHPSVEIAAFAANDAILTALNSGTAGNSIVTVETFTAPTNIFDAGTLGTTTAGSDTTAAASIAFIGTQSVTKDYQFVIGSEIINITLIKGTTATQAAAQLKALIDARVSLAVNTGTIVSDVLPLTAKHAGATGNEIGIRIDGIIQGIAMNLVAFSGGVGTPEVAVAAANFQERYTHVVNAFDHTQALDDLEAQNEIFWGPLENRFFVSYYGSKDTSATNVIVDTDARLTERTNSKIPVLGSPSTHVEIAASAAAYAAIISNGNPPKPYYDAVIFGILPGAPTVIQWTYAERDFVTKGGCSTTYVDDGEVRIGDLVTTYHPSGVDNPGYRYNVDVTKVQLITSDISKLFKGVLWQGKILIEDTSNATNPEVRKPSTAKAHVLGLAEQWSLDGVIQNLDFTKENTVAEIDPSNANRLNIVIPVILSGAARLRAIDLQFSTEVRRS